MKAARRQKNLPEANVPECVLLDPDGDILRYLRAERIAERDANWACYHTDLYRFEWNGRPYGIIACAVGGPYAVLLAEELFACKCKLLVSVTSAGQITPVADPPYYILITKALRDEGTSYHYAPPARFAEIDTRLREALDDASRQSELAIVDGPVWTTDAPFRETQSTIDARRDEGILAVEMEAASLYAYSTATGNPVVCFAHVTNQMAATENDFEKGEAGGSITSLAVLDHAARALADTVGVRGVSGTKGV